MDPERIRLGQIRRQPWRKWGPYLSERQWGTVREDYSEDGDAWNYFPHEHAHARAYRWGEDGIAGICDEQQILCFSLAFWNGNDRILKERLFGLTNLQGNHGEDVKEYYYYLDNTPTHSYMKYLYKYPQAAYPYNDIVRLNAQRGRDEPEYELIDTGVFDEDRYFDVVIEYVKQAPEDILIRITVHNRGDAPAELHVLPMFWYRNQWSWRGTTDKPQLRQIENEHGLFGIHAHDANLGDRWLWCERATSLLFTENETNNARLFGGVNAGRYAKDGINDYVVHGKQESVNPAGIGTRAAAHYRATVSTTSPLVLRLRLTDAANVDEHFFEWHFDDVMAARQHEADQFYAKLAPPQLDIDTRRIMRQALAGMLWSKQYYCYEVERWLKERGKPFAPFPSQRNHDWRHMNNANVVSVPDKWEYPWLAAWDLAFHALPISLVDPEFARDQLDLVLRERYLHPNGQMPACEWNFGDITPPVHAWATIFTYRLLQSEDRDDTNWRWLDHTFQKLLLNFNWWLNRRDRTARTVLEGGFFGIDSIGAIDRRGPPISSRVEHADGTAWMAFYAQSMCEIAVALLEHDPGYGDMVLKFLEHFLSIAAAMMHLGDGERQLGMWDDTDGFFYDVLRFGPIGGAVHLKVRSIVGLLPLCAVTVFEGSLIKEYPEPAERFRRFLEVHPELIDNVHDLRKPGHSGRLLLSILDERRLRQVLTRVLDEKEFLSAYGIRSLSRIHAEQPYIVRAGDQEYRIAYVPGLSDSAVCGGNSNWHGPVSMPINALIIRALLTYYRYYGNAFRIECPTGSGRLMTLYEVANEIAHRLTTIYLPNTDGKRPVFGHVEKFQTDPHWRDHLLFCESFNGDTGEGIGASHQTGWSGAIARIIHIFANTTPEAMLDNASLFRRLSTLFPNDRRLQVHRRGSD